MNHFSKSYRFLILMNLVIIGSNFTFAQLKQKYGESGSYYEPHEMLREFSKMSVQSDSGLTLISRLPGGRCDAVAAKDKYVFIGNGDLIQTLDMSVPEVPKVVGEIVTGGIITDMKLKGNYLYSVYPFRIIDISDPTTLHIISTLHNLDATKITIDSAFAYVGDAGGAVTIVDVSDP